MLADKTLTETILKMREGRIGRGLKEEYIEFLFSVIIDLYKSNKWIKCSVAQTDQGIGYVRAYLTNVQNKGFYFIIYTDDKYFKKGYGNSISLIRIQNFFEIYFKCTNENSCAGIIFNPTSSEEFVLTDSCIREIFMSIDMKIN